MQEQATGYVSPLLQSGPDHEDRRSILATRRRTTSRADAQVAQDDHYHVCLAYQLGGLPCYFLPNARALRIVDRPYEDFPPVPPALQGWVSQLRDLVARLARCAPAQLAEPSATVQHAVREFLAEYETQWGGESHREFLDWYENASEEWPVDPILDSPSWNQLRTAVQTFIQNLPACLVPWTRLGELIAEALVHHEGSPQAIMAMSLVSTQFAELACHPTIIALSESVLNWNHGSDRVCRLLAIHTRLAAGLVSSGTEDEADVKKVDQPRLTADTKEGNVVIDGVVHCVGPGPAAVVSELLEANGLWRSSNEMKLANPQLAGARVDRLITQLPDKVRDIIISGGPKGYRLQLEALE
jgi:hypothetical protein